MRKFKKILKWTGITILSLLIIFVVLVFSLQNKKFKAPYPDIHASNDSTIIARGEYLANHVTPCIDCHSKRDFTKLSGPVIPGTEGMGGEVFDNKLEDDIPGVVYSRNITPDPETGIGGSGLGKFIQQIGRYRPQMFAEAQGVGGFLGGPAGCAKPMYPQAHGFSREGRQ